MSAPDRTDDVRQVILLRLRDGQMALLRLSSIIHPTAMLSSSVHPRMKSKST
jgi:hypothetical protein